MSLRHRRRRCRSPGDDVGMEEEGGRAVDNPRSDAQGASRQTIEFGLHNPFSRAASSGAHPINIVSDGRWSLSLRTTRQQ